MFIAASQSSASTTTLFSLKPFGIRPSGRPIWRSAPWVHSVGKVFDREPLYIHFSSGSDFRAKLKAVRLTRLSCPQDSSRLWTTTAQFEFDNRESR